MAIWHEAHDLATQAFDDIERQGGTPTPDQKLALAQIYATLSVSQELSSMIKDEGLSVRIDTLRPMEQVGENAPTPPKSPMTVLRAPENAPRIGRSTDRRR